MEAFSYGYEAYIERAERRIPDPWMDLVAFVGGGFYVSFFFEIDIGSPDSVAIEANQVGCFSNRWNITLA
jgi:hypothetical protein